MCQEIGNNFVSLLLSNGKLIPVDTEIDYDKIEFPPWYNEKLFKKGQQYFTRNIFAMFVGMLCGLIAVLAIPSILNVLICTRKSSTIADAYRRYIRTIFIIVTWNWFSFGSTKSMESRAWQSLISVRKTHLTSSKHCSAVHKSFISQTDMALTQYGFMGFITLKANLLGLNATDDDFLSAIVHFWRVIGYMLGIQDEYNLCTDNWLTTKNRLEAVTVAIYKPSLTNASDEFMEMTTALVDGMWSFNPLLSVQTFLYFTRRLAGCDGYEYFRSDYENDEAEKHGQKLYKTLPKYNRSTLFILIHVMQTLYTYKVFKWYFNLQIYTSLILIYWFPFLAFHRFGFRKSYVRITHKFN